MSVVTSNSVCRKRHDIVCITDDISLSRYDVVDQVQLQECCHSVCLLSHAFVRRDITVTVNASTNVLDLTAVGYDLRVIRLTYATVYLCRHLYCDPCLASVSVAQSVNCSAYGQDLIVLCAF